MCASCAAPRRAVLRHAVMCSVARCHAVSCCVVPCGAAHAPMSASMRVSMRAVRACAARMCFTTEAHLVVVHQLHRHRSETKQCPMYCTSPCRSFRDKDALSRCHPCKPHTTFHSLRPSFAILIVTLRYDKCVDQAPHHPYSVPYNPPLCYILPLQRTLYFPFMLHLRLLSRRPSRSMNSEQKSSGRSARPGLADRLDSPGGTRTGLLECLRVGSL